jgi:hypothetical protein
MAIPSNPTIAEIVTEGLKRAGRTSPTATQISDATTHNLREVKADIMLIAPTHPYLQTTAYTVTVKGQSRYSLPPEANIPVSLTCLAGPTDWAGTATAGASTTITLAASLSEDELNLLGKTILLTGGTGVSQARTCTGWNNTTKVFTVDLAWVTTPGVTTTYQIISMSRSLWQSEDAASEYDKRNVPYGLGIPYLSSQYGDEFMLYPIPDASTYGLFFRYYVDLDQLDDAGAIFLNLLREWRSLWIQGIAVKAMQRFDEDRYQGELAVYKLMLDMLSAQTSRVVVGRWTDV